MDTAIQQWMFDTTERYIDILETRNATKPVIAFMERVSPCEYEHVPVIWLAVVLSFPQ